MVQHFLERNAAVRPDKVALVCGPTRFSYGQLDKMANRLANAFLEQGVRRGDRVAVYLSNCVEAVVSFFAALKAGGIFVPINRTTKAEKLLFILGQCGATVLVADTGAFAEGLHDRLRNEVPSLRSVVFCPNGRAAPVNGSLRCYEFEWTQAGFSPTVPRSEAIDLDLACVIYTSGTTGEPKGVMCDHSNVTFVADAINLYLETNDGDVILNVLPLSSSYGLYQLLTTFCVGGTLVLEESFAFPARIVQKLAEHRVTGFAGVPTIYSLLLGLDLGRANLSALRYLTNAAAGLPVEHVKRLRKALPNVKLFLMHGLTEVARTMYLPPEQADIRPASSGIPIPGVELWLEDENGGRLGPGQVGELVVRGRNVMRGYWKNGDLDGKRFMPGPLPGERVCYTGDLFRTDEEGFYYFVSRKDDIIKSRGEKIAPREVENVLYGIPGVQDAAVIGIPDLVLGQAIKAFVVAPGAHLTEAKVLSHCRAHLQEVMVPRHVEFRDALPRTANGKILKIALC